jgi:hypothetical protein
MLAYDAIVAYAAGMYQGIASDADPSADYRGVQSVGDVHGAGFPEPTIDADAYVLAVRAQQSELA